MWKQYNPNPCGKMVGDCVIRGISKVLEQTWEKTYTDLCFEGLTVCDMPSSNSVWGNYLKKNGFIQKAVDIQPVEALCQSLPKGVYLLATGSHVVAMIDGNYYDAWDSGMELVSYLFVKGE